MLRGWNFTLWVVGNHWDFLSAYSMYFRKLPVKCREIRDGKCQRQPEHFYEFCSWQMSALPFFQSKSKLVQLFWKVIYDMDHELKNVILFA